jgi:hypothetical protein
MATEERNEEVLTAREHGRLIAADKVEGTPVVDPTGEKLGSIERIMIDKPSGKVAYAVMSFGGFLGIGDRHHALPWGALKYDTNLDGYVVNLDRQRLENAPTFARDDAIDLEDPAMGRQLHDYYGVAPYWG